MLVYMYFKEGFIMQQTILVVEDEKNIRDAIVAYLKNANYQVIEADNGKAALDTFADHHVDLVILDVMLPMLDGWTVLRRIRNTSSVFVIMLTALGEEYDKLQGFELGADEYVTKPFSPKVLVARVKAMLGRSPKAPTKAILQKGNIELDKDSHQVLHDDEVLSLTPKEFIILEYLMSNEQTALTREQILTHVWGYDYYGDTRVVDTHIKNLRAKLKGAGHCIRTVTGVGYRFEVRDHEK